VVPLLSSPLGARESNGWEKLGLGVKKRSLMRQQRFGSGVIRGVRSRSLSEEGNAANA
jgi:hypothetical protein